MSTTLKISSGKHSDAGIKDSNDDACGIRVPKDSLLNTKGIALVIADGVSGSEAGKEAANACVKGFLSDYFSTPESWSTKSAGGKTLSALNRWLYAQGHKQYESVRAMVTTLSVLIIKSTTAYIFHVGDTRIYRFRKGKLTCLTKDHRVVVSEDKNYLSRAMGIELHMEIDYQSLSVQSGDVYLLTTDGVHDYMDDATLAGFLYDGALDVDKTTKFIVSGALENGSHDNVTCQIVKIEELPNSRENEFYDHFSKLPFPPPLESGMVLDGYEIIRELHASKRTQIYLALDRKTNTKIILKTPSVNFDDDPEYIERFLHEEWAGSRVKSPHVLKVLKPPPNRQCLYYVTEYIEGQTLRQRMDDNRALSIEDARNIVGQLATGLRAFHRQEMLHQDLKPENIIIDSNGTVKIIDFGSAKIAGIEEITTPLAQQKLLGTLNYTAPEYFQEHAGNNASDLYSLAVIAYEMLTGHLPYGKDLKPGKLLKARYTPARNYNLDIPIWMDKALEKATSINRHKRYGILSEFIYDLAHPNEKFAATKSVPLLKRNPLGFWKFLAGFLFILNIILLIRLSGQ